MTKYDDVRIIGTNKVGLLVEIKNDKYLVEFDDGSTAYFDECDLLLAQEEDDD